MVVVDYSQHFWGEKHLGFHVLYQNLKQGEDAITELGVFVKDRITTEEEHGKMLGKNLARVSAKCPCMSQSQVNTFLTANTTAFASTWTMTRGTLESMSEIQTSLTRNLHALARDIAKYHDDLVKSRRRVKEQDVVDAVNLMQTTTTCLQKAKETYATRCVELDKLRKENTNPKEIVKAENKIVKARDEYRQYVEKYGVVRGNFEEKMVKAARAFQAHDEAHLQQMKVFMAAYAKHVEDAQTAASQISLQFRESINQLNVEDVMLKFIEEKATGMERPEVAVFEEPDLGEFPQAILPLSASSQSIASSTTPHAITIDNLNEIWNHDSPAQVQAHSSGVDFLRHQQPSPSDSGSSSTTMGAVGGSAPVASSTSSSFVPSTLSTSLGRQKLSLWLPKRKKNASHTSLPTSDAAAIATAPDFAQSTSETGFLKKRYRKSKKSLNDCTTQAQQASSAFPPIADIANVAGVARNEVNLFDDARSTTSSSKSDDRMFASSNGFFGTSGGLVGGMPLNVMDLPLGPPPPLPQHPPPSNDVDDEGFTIRKDLAANASNEKEQWSSCTDSSDDDDDDECRNEVRRTSKIRQLSIRPLDATGDGVGGVGKTQHASVDELRDAVGNITLNCATMPRSSTFDQDPWTASIRSFSMSNEKQGRPLRPAFTGDEHLRPKFAEADFQRSNVACGPPLNFSASSSAVPGTIARARPRSNTPTVFASSNANPFASSANNIAFARQDSIDSTEGGGSAFLRSDSIASLSGGIPGDSPFSGSGFFGMSPTFVDMQPQRVPIAMAVNEYIHAWFRSEKPTVRTFATVMVSFSRSSIELLTDMHADLEALQFRLVNAQKIKSILPNKQLILPDSTHDEGSAVYKFTCDRLGLANFLLSQQQAKPNSAFYNVEVLRYELQDVGDPPLHVKSYWKTDTIHTDLRVDYRLNTTNSNCPLVAPLLNIAFATKIDGRVANVIAEPKAEWAAGNETLTWNLTELSRHGDCSGSLKARLSLETGPSTPANTFVQFQTADASLSGVSVVVDCPHYQLSMLRRKVLAGKYFCEPEVRK